MTYASDLEYFPLTKPNVGAENDLANIWFLGVFSASLAEIKYQMCTQEIQLPDKRI